MFTTRTASTAAVRAAGGSMSLGAVRVKEEPACAATEDVTIKEEPELVEAEHVPPLCVQQVNQLEPACTKQEPPCAPEVLGELEPEYTDLETVCFKDEPISVQQPVCVKQEPPWQDSVGSELDQEFKYEIPVVSGPLPADTPSVKGTKWDCFVRLERCVVPRGAAPRARRPRARHETPAPHVSRAHEREIAMKQLSGTLIKRIGKIDNSYSCQICKKQYKRLACLTTHKLGHTKMTRSKVRSRSDKNTYFCEICKAVFPDLDSLKVHALIHAKITIPLHLCDICHREFATNHALRTHKRAHMHSRPFKCKFCKERFTRQNDLSRHLAGHREHKPKEKLTKFCKGCETKQAIKQLGGLLGSPHSQHSPHSPLGQTRENTHFCELCNNMGHYGKTLFENLL